MLFVERLATTIGVDIFETSILEKEQPPIEGPFGREYHFPDCMQSGLHREGRGHDFNRHVGEEEALRRVRCQLKTRYEFDKLVETAS